MKIINVKKLIVSTLLFLFASYTTPALGDEPLTYLPSRASIEQEAVKSDISLGPHRLFSIDSMKFSSQTIKEKSSYKYLFSEPFTPYRQAILSYSDDSFVASSVAYVWQGNTLNPTQLHLLESYEEALNLSQTGAKVITSAKSDTKLFLMPGWDFRGSLPSFYFYSMLFIGAYLAFSGARKLHKDKTPLVLHTKGWPVTMPHASRIIQLLAMHVAKVDELRIPKKEQALWEYAIGFIRKAKGKSLTTLFRALAGE